MERHHIYSVEYTIVIDGEDCFHWPSLTIAVAAKSSESAERKFRNYFSRNYPQKECIVDRVSMIFLDFIM